MSIKRRIFNVARAELKSATGKMKRGATRLFDAEPTESETSETESDEQASSEPTPSRSQEPGEAQRIRRFYANLELPVGAPIDEVKAAYRRLVRRYHPDRHQTDDARRKTATELARELRVAYEGLVEHLEKKTR